MAESIDFGLAFRHLTYTAAGLKPVSEAYSAASLAAGEPISVRWRRQ